VTAQLPARTPDEAEDIDHICDLVRAGAVGPWHYRWLELTTVAARLGVTPHNAVYLAHDGNWSPNRKPAATAADFIREANAR